MGIKNLNKLLKTRAPDSIRKIHLSEYSYKKVAIDISLYMCKYKAIYGETWLYAFLKLVGSLRKNEIHCVFIFDGKAPEDKSEEKIRRKNQKQKLEKTVYELEIALNSYYQTGIVEKILQDLYNKRRGARLLKKEARIDMDWVEEKIKQKKKQILNISEKDFDLVKVLFQILDVPFYTAPGEAEKMCSKLCIDGLVDAVLSEDTDVLAYRSPCFLSKIDTRSETCTLIEFTEIIKELELDKDEFLDVCIMCGTDYNTNIPKVGSINSYKLIQQHGSIENVAENTKYDISILKHIRGRELFTTFEDYKLESIPYCGQPNFEKLIEFTKKNNIQINLENLRKNFVKELVQNYNLL